MKKKATKLLHSLFISSLLIFCFVSAVPPAATSNLQQQKTQQSVKSSSSDITTQEFKPSTEIPSWADKDNNGITDSFYEEIVQRMLNNTDEDYVNVIAMFRNQPTVDDVNAFVSLGGYITTPVWTWAIYGFGGQLPYNQILKFVQSTSNVLLIDKEHTCNAHVAYAAKQVGVRTYVWNTLGFQGDPNSSIAIVDTGIDDSHPDFSLGFGDKDFSKKIVGWNDQITPGGTLTPVDDEGHGSHVAGLAAGNGFFSTDGSGNSIATWGAHLGLLSGIYPVSGMMVNKAGPITINVKWRNARQGTLDALYLYYGDKALIGWSQVASVSTPSQDTWHTLNYNVASTPSGGYDMYHIALDFTALSPRDDFYVVFKMSWPYSSPSDGFQGWTGIAPQTKLVGVKVMDYLGSGTDTELLSGINWIITNRQTYHIVIASMSLGFGQEVASVNTAIVNLVNSGVTTIVSAGNDGYGGNLIHTPGSVDEAITVAATNQFDNIVDFSGEGGPSWSTGKTIKPDIAAPGGSFYAVPLFSADSNDWDASKKWLDVQLNDGAPMQGTSMSAPIVSGAASIIVQVLGGFSSWHWTRSQALKPKMVLLMTATETYPNYREPNLTPPDAPTLQRGGKDAHEGYGRLNLDVAVDALLKTLEVGAIVTDTLGKPPTIADISGLGQKLAWARNVQLNTAGKCNFTLIVPSGADFDLYLYNSTGTLYGEPAIVAKSTNATTGGQEQIILSAPYNGTYYLVVKRATSTTQGGTFTLESTFTPNHDVTVLDVYPSSTTVYEGNKLNVTVNVKNKGLNMESFNVTAFYNSTSFGEQTIWNLPAGAESSLNFTWDTFGVIPDYYLVEAQAQSVPHEYNSTDNTRTYDGLIHVKILGDVNGDDVVASSDLVQLNLAYGSILTSVNWNSECDFNQDNIINVIDLKTLGKNYGVHI